MNQQVEELKKFGEVYQGSDGKKYLNLGISGIRLERCKPFRAKVEKFTMNDEAPAWWSLKLAGFEKVFMLYNNAMKEIGEPFKEGEEVEGVMDTEEPKFWEIRRVK